jgi:hypothetical protein
MYMQSAQYMLSSLLQDSRLRRWGQELASRGGMKGKRRAVIAVARKMAMLLHKLRQTNWVRTSSSA